MTQLQDMGFTRSHIATAQAVTANNTLEKVVSLLSPPIFSHIIKANVCIHAYT